MVMCFFIYHEKHETREKKIGIGGKTKETALILKGLR